MKIRSKVLVAGAIALGTVGAGYAALTTQNVPAGAVELVEEINYGPQAGPMVRWPHGLYTTLGACKGARTDFIGPKGSGATIDTNKPLAMWTCGGNAYFSGQVTNLVPPHDSPTTYYDAALNQSITAMNVDGSIPQ